MKNLKIVVQTALEMKFLVKKDKMEGFSKVNEVFWKHVQPISFFSVVLSHTMNISEPLRHSLHMN